MKKALILFPDEWIAYSPSILNLRKCLSKTHEVTIICFQLDQFDLEASLTNVEYIHIPEWLFQLGRRLNRFKDLKLRMLKQRVKRKKNIDYDLVFGVDSIGYLAAKSYFSKVIFYSLEINQEKNMQRALQLGIEQLIIQSEPRKEYLIGKESDTQVHYIQNSPILTEAPSQKVSFNKKLVYFGNIKIYYGIEHCVEALEHLDNDYTLTLKGIKDEKYYETLVSKYAHIIKAGRLLFDFSYAPQEEVISYLDAFDIGFSMFDFSYGHETDFNYLSSPSGKMFNYFATGMPVIGNNIVGFKVIEEYNAGILIDSITPLAIASAVQTIEKNFEFYSGNSCKAGVANDFKVGFDKFITTQ